MQRAFELKPITLWIQCDQPVQELMAAHMCFCLQPLWDEIGMGLKGIQAAAAALTQLGVSTMCLSQTEVDWIDERPDELNEPRQLRLMQAT